MSFDSPEFQYVSGQGRPSFAALLADYEMLNAEAIADQPCTLELHYGDAPRQRFDFFPARSHPRGTVAYFHAGYGQSRDKSGFRFVAPAFTRRGFNVALVNYPLCPTVTLDGLLACTRQALPAIRAHALSLGQAETALIAAGHSAGGHIAVELALTRWPDRGVAGVIALSGIYDLEPLVATSLNTKLRLDADAARVHSPLHRAQAGAAPALFIVGGDETPAFVEQSRSMQQAWRAAGNPAELQIVAGADHFSLLRAVTAVDVMLAAAIDDLLERAQRRFEAATT